MTSAVPFTIKTITKEELIRSNAASGSIFSEVTKLEERSLQKSLDSLHGFKILTELVKVIEKPDDSLTTYTFPTINFRDNKLKNVVVTEKNGAFATYIISYEYMTDGSTKIQQQLVSNDNSGLTKNSITIATTHCEWRGIVSPRDFEVSYGWVCETTYETFFFSDSVGGGSGGGGSTGGDPNGGGTQGGNDGSGTWGSSPGGGGGGGGGGGMTIITQPTYSNHLTSLKALSDDPSLKAEIKDWIETELVGRNSELGTEYFPGLNGALSFRQVAVTETGRLGVQFGPVAIDGLTLRNHLHYDGLSAMFSGGDFFGHLNFFSQNNAGNFYVNPLETTSMVVSSFGVNPSTNKPVPGVYALRIADSADAIADLQRLETADLLNPQFSEADFLHTNFSMNVINLTEIDYRDANHNITSNMPLTEQDYTSRQFIGMYESNFMLLLNHYQLDDSILVFRANLDSNNNVISWTKL